ncbi:hypothetical protein DS906_14545 [Ruegeria sp. A3M17]|nr:hypothetical protein DS906_14545 [Ruegeria sp. A3M17]
MIFVQIWMQWLQMFVGRKACTHTFIANLACGHQVDRHHRIGGKVGFRQKMVGCSKFTYLAHLANSTAIWTFIAGRNLDLIIDPSWFSTRLNNAFIIQSHQLPFRKRTNNDCIRMSVSSPWKVAPSFCLRIFIKQVERFDYRRSIFFEFRSKCFIC